MHSSWGPTATHVLDRYLLLMLVRARQGDANPGGGWLYTDELARMLDTDEAYLNVLVHRARKALEALGVADAASVVERRRSTKQVRAGFANAQIRRQ